MKEYVSVQGDKTSRIEKIRKFWNSEYANPREKEDVDFLLAEIDSLTKENEGLKDRLEDNNG